ncbi:MAG: type IV pilin protein [Solimonas sp.]
MTGVSLIELVVVIGIIAILAALAVPSYSDYRHRVIRVSGEDCLSDAQQRMERHFASRSRYTAAIGDLGYGNPASCGQDGAYVLSIATPSSACPISRCYAITATAQGSQAADGNMRLTYKAAELNPNERVVKERNKGGTWTSGWE